MAKISVANNFQPNFELSTIFDYLFGKVFGIIEMENYLHDILTSKERNYFSHLSLQRVKLFKKYEIYLFIYFFYISKCK